MVSTRHHPLDNGDGTISHRIDLTNLPYSSPYKYVKKAAATTNSTNKTTSKSGSNGKVKKDPGSKEEGKGIKKDKKEGIKKEGEPPGRGKRLRAKEKAQEKGPNAKGQEKITDLFGRPITTEGGDEEMKGVKWERCGKAFDMEKVEELRRGCRKRKRGENEEGERKGGKRVKCKCGRLVRKEVIGEHGVDCEGRQDCEDVKGDKDEQPKPAAGKKRSAEDVAKKNVLNCPGCGEAYYAHKLEANLKRCKRTERKIEDEKPAPTYDGGKGVKWEECGSWITMGKMEKHLERCMGSGKGETQQETTTPHTLSTLKTTTETLLKDVAHWTEVVDKAVRETRGAQPMAKAGKQEGEASEAYLMWTALMYKVKEAGRACGFTQQTYNDTATNDKELAAAEARTQKLEEELGNVGDGQEIGEEEIKKAIPEGGISRGELLGLFRERIGRERGGVRAFWKRITKVAEDVDKDGMLRLKNLRDSGGRATEDEKDDEDEDEDEDNPGRGKPGAGGTVITTADDDVDLALV